MLKRLSVMLVIIFLTAIAFAPVHAEECFVLFEIGYSDDEENPFRESVISEYLYIYDGRFQEMRVRLQDTGRFYVSSNVRGEYSAYDIEFGTVSGGVGILSIDSPSVFHVRERRASYTTTELLLASFEPDGRVTVRTVGTTCNDTGPWRGSGGLRG